MSTVKAAGSLPKPHQTLWGIHPLGYALELTGSQTIQHHITSQTPTMARATRICARYPPG